MSRKEIIGIIIEIICIVIAVVRLVIGIICKDPSAIRTSLAMLIVLILLLIYMVKRKI